MSRVTWTDHGDYIQCDSRYDPDRSVIGYARVSTPKQKLDQQIKELKQAGCFRIYKEIESTRKRRRIFESLTDVCTRQGDVLMVWKFDRLGRDVAEVTAAANLFLARGVELHSLTEVVDLRTAYGRFSFNVIVSFSQLERDVISERTKAGLARVKSEGKQLGNPTECKGERKIKMLRDIWDLSLTNVQIAKRNGYKSTATQVQHFKSEKKAARAAFKEGPALFRQKRLARFKEVAKQERVPIRRLNEIVRTGETYH